MGNFVTGLAIPAVSSSGTSSSAGSASTPAAFYSAINDRIANEREAAHFLRQASLGPTLVEIQEVLAIGSRSRWIQQQIASRFSGTGYAEWTVTPTTVTVNPGWYGTIANKLRVPSGSTEGTGNDGVTHGTNAPTNPSSPGTVFAHRTVLTPLIRNRPLTAPFTDAQSAVWQDVNATLMLKVAWVYSMMFPVSTTGGAFEAETVWASQVSWMSLLCRNAFRPYKELLRAITYNPSMAKMLTYSRNKRMADGGGPAPDENYAREIMQLFTIGLNELNLDGSEKLDENGNPIPTYNNNDIAVLARAFTGLTRWDRPNAEYDSLAYVNATMDGDPTYTTRERLKFSHTANTPMPTERLLYPGHNTAGVGAHLVAYAGWHDTGAKYALDGRINLPAGRTADQDIDAVLEALVNHPSCAPFVATRLIRHTVTSNPSPEYIARVASVFRNNGSGQVGDMAAVWTAILCDPEAANTIHTSPTHGRVRLPFEHFCNHIRSFDRRQIQRVGTAPANTAANSIWLPNVSGTSTYQSGLVDHIIQTDVGHFTYQGNLNSWIMMSPSIFGFHSPDGAPKPANSRGFLMPEGEAVPAAVQMTATTNVVGQFFGSTSPRGRPSDETAATVIVGGTDRLTAASYTLSLGAGWDAASTAGATHIVERLNWLLCGGTLTKAKADEIVACIEGMPVSTDTEKENRVAMAGQLICRTTEYWVM